MPIDASIYQNLRPIEMPSILDSKAKAMSLSQLAMQNNKLAMEAQENQATREAFSKHGMGKESRGALLSDLAKANPAKALEYQTAFGKLDSDALEQQSKALDEQIKHVSLASSLALGARDQGSYDQMLQQIQGMGIETTNLPKQYDPGLMKQMAYMSTKQSERLAVQKQELDEKLGWAKLALEKGSKDPSKLPPGARLAKMGGEVKQKIGHLTSGLQALTNYEGAFREGGRQSYLDPSTPGVGALISSTPIDEARTSIEEAIGRLASGGAINKDEESRFRRMLPRAADSDEDSARKLVNLRKEMEGKLTAYGFQPEELGDVGYNPADLGYGTEFSEMENRGLIQKKKNKSKLNNDAFAGDNQPGFTKMTDAQLDEQLLNLGIDPKTGGKIK